DEHLRRALLRDSTAVSYLPLSLIYDPETGKPVKGITVIPPDLNGNGRINEDEKFYGDLVTVVQRLEETPRRISTMCRWRICISLLTGGTRHRRPLVS